MIQREYPKHPLVGVAAVVLKDERVLLVKRGNRPSKGEWSLPGGLVELGETHVQALQREVQEELSIEIEILGPVGVFDRILRDRDNSVQYHYVIVDYCAQIISGSPRAGSDAAMIKWVHLKNLEKFSQDPMLTKAVSKGLHLYKNKVG